MTGCWPVWGSLLELGRMYGGSRSDKAHPAGPISAEQEEGLQGSAVKQRGEAQRREWASAGILRGDMRDSWGVTRSVARQPARSGPSTATGAFSPAAGQVMAAGAHATVLSGLEDRRSGRRGRGTASRGLGPSQGFWLCCIIFGRTTCHLYYDVLNI